MYYTDLLNILSIYLQIMNIYIYIYTYIYLYSISLDWNWDLNPFSIRRSRFPTSSRCSPMQQRWPLVICVFFLSGTARMAMPIPTQRCLSQKKFPCERRVLMDNYYGKIMENHLWMLDIMWYTPVPSGNSTVCYVKSPCCICDSSIFHGQV